MYVEISSYMWKMFCSNAVMLLSSRFTISLVLNGEAVNAWKRVNCTTAKFNLFNVRVPQSIVLCKQNRDNQPIIVGGLDLHGGRMYN